MWYSLIHGLGALFFWVIVIFLIVWFIKHLSQSSGGICGRNENSALTILKERYARGEIGKDEFDAKKKDLSE